MGLHPQTLSLIIPLIEEFEGVRLEAYLCPAGVPTICAGLTIYPNNTPVMMGDVCTDVACKGYLLEMLRDEYAPCLQKLPGWSDLGAHRQAVLLSFAWNFGKRFYGAPGFETISKVIYEGAQDPQRYSDMRDALMLYCKSGGNTIAGLLRRREKEADLWDKEDDGVMVITTIADTLFKKAPIDSMLLSDGQGKLPVKAGNSIPITRFLEAQSNHAEVTIEGTGDVWFIYQPHWEVSSEKKH